MFCYCIKLGAKRAELVQLMQKFVHEVASEFFARNAPNPHSWSETHVWIHLGLFRYCTKLDAKRVELVELMYKFVP